MSCGGTTFERPQPDNGQDPLVSSGFDASRKPPPALVPGTAAASASTSDLILAHVLDTEALRILLPVATAMVEERMASFAAALMAGVAAKYGGDPDHLDVVAATMPDTAPDIGTGRRRRFLVLHDTLPRGTGYLQRLADQAEFRDVLEAGPRASSRTAPASTRPSGPATAACSATSATTSSTWSPAPRRSRMLDDLLDDWATASVPRHRPHLAVGPGGKRA